MRTFTRILALACAWLLMMPFAALAQDSGKPPNIGSIYILYPKEGKFAELEAGIKAHGEWRTEHGDPRAWQVFTPVASEDLGSYGIRHCCFRWADEDAYDKWQSESGALDAYNEQIGPYVSKVAHYYQVIDIKNSNWAADAPDYPLIKLIQWTPKPGTEGDRAAAMDAFTSVTNEHDWPYNWAWSWRQGGKAELTLALPYTSFADMEVKGPSFYEFFASHTSPEEAAETFSKFSSSFWSSKEVIVRWRPDLSMRRQE